MDKKFVDPRLLEPHYSTRIYKGYLMFLRKRLGETTARKIVAKTGVTWDYLMNEQNWVSEDFAEAFYDELAHHPELGKDYSYQAGRLAMSKDGLGLPQLLGMRMMNPSAIYRQLYYFSQRFNKVDHYEFSLKSPSALTLKFKSHRKTKHLDQVAESWRGFLQHIPSMFYQQDAQVKVDFIGEQEIDFEVKWNPATKVLLLNRFMLITGLLFLGSTCTFIYGLLGGLVSKMAIQLSAASLVTLILGKIASSFFRRKLFAGTDENYKRILKESEERYQELYVSKQKLDRRYQEANLLREVIGRISRCASSDELIDTTLKEIKERLQYHRVIYMKYFEKSQLLKVTQSVGFNAQIQRMIHEYSIDLREETKSPYHLGNVFKLRKSLLVDVAADYFSSLSEQGKLMIYVTKSRSFLAVPVVTDFDEFGILLVDYSEGDLTLNQDDLHIIENVANQLAISLQSAINLEKERQLRITFQQFVPEQVTRSVMGENHEKLERGIKKHVTVLFSDLRNFTKHSTQMQPAALVRALNLYFHRMTEIVYANGGIVDKFIGDGMFAIFNAFEDSEDHAIRATRAACQMQRSIPELNAKILEQESDPSNRYELETGIGLHSGAVTLCMIGTEKKREFTAIGETVNIAARLEGMSKMAGPSAVVISTAVKSQIHQGFLLGDLGNHAIRGVPEKQQLWSVLGEKLPNISQTEEETEGEDESKLAA